MLHCLVNIEALRLTTMNWKYKREKQAVALSFFSGGVERVPFIGASEKPFFFHFRNFHTNTREQKSIWRVFNFYIKRGSKKIQRRRVLI